MKTYLLICLTLFREYIDNLNYVDKKIEEVVQMTETYFGPGTTSYIFTSDHGMTDWGSHGSGSSDETKTPFVAWGAGLKVNPQSKDIEQADITPLISALLGIPIPVNNEVRLTFFINNHKNSIENIESYLCQIKI